MQWTRRRFPLLLLSLSLFLSLSPWPPPNALHPLLTVCPGAPPPLPTDRPAAAPVSESHLGKGAAAAAVGEGWVASPRGCSSVPVMRLTVCSSEPPASLRAASLSVCLFRAFPHCSFPSPKTAKHTENRKTQTNSSVFIFFSLAFLFPPSRCVAAAVAFSSSRLHGRRGFRTVLPLVSFFPRARMGGSPPALSSLLNFLERRQPDASSPLLCFPWPNARSDPSAVGGCQFGTDGPNGGVLPGKHADSHSCSLPLSC